MKTSRFTRTALFLVVTASLLALPAPRATAQTVEDEVAVIRSVVKADREMAVADAMMLTGAEGTAFWPLYRDYRVEMNKLGDGVVKLVLEYADAYPVIAEDRAERMLKDLLALEQDLVSVRARHVKKIAKVLPKSKALRFAQVESRLDLALRLQIATAFPLGPAVGSKP